MLVDMNLHSFTPASSRRNRRYIYCMLSYHYRSTQHKLERNSYTYEGYHPHIYSGLEQRSQAWEYIHHCKGSRVYHKKNIEYQLLHSKYSKFRDRESTDLQQGLRFRRCEEDRSCHK